MNLTCFYCQTPFTLSMDQKIAALRKMHAENLHHYDAHCPRCGRANAISRERLEMFTPGWEEAIKEPVAAMPAAAGAGAPRGMEQPNTIVPSRVPKEEPAAMPARARKAPARKRHAPAAKKPAKTTAKKAATKKSAAKSKKSSTKKASTKKTAKKKSR